MYVLFVIVQSHQVHLSTSPLSEWVRQVSDSSGTHRRESCVTVKSFSTRSSTTNGPTRSRTSLPIPPSYRQSSMDSRSTRTFGSCKQPFYLNQCLMNGLIPQTGPTKESITAGMKIIEMIDRRATDTQKWGQRQQQKLKKMSTQNRPRMMHPKIRLVKMNLTYIDL